VPAACAELDARLGALPHLAADVSDMRAVFRIEHGLAARETVAKLAPVDLAPGRFEAGTLRRTRLAQIPAAIWWEEDGITLVCFRSVARYAFDVLAQAAAEGGAVDYFAPA
jgi:sarcosine oxidase subunit gamma